MTSFITFVDRAAAAATAAVTDVGQMVVIAECTEILKPSSELPRRRRRFSASYY